MALIAGASQYLGQATLSQKTGSTFSPGNIVGAASLLDAGRATSFPGIGLSASARALTNSQLDSSSGTYNQLFSLSGGGSATTEASQIQILGMRATATASRDVIIQDDGTVSSAKVGTQVDTEA